jgi:hypothetical protein
MKCGLVPSAACQDTSALGIGVPAPFNTTPFRLPARGAAAAGLSAQTTAAAIARKNAAKSKTFLIETSPET